MNYQQNLTPKELNFQLLIGLKRHLLIAENTSKSKSDRLTSINNIAEVLEFVLLHMNNNIPQEELQIYQKFFTHLLTKITKAKILIHSDPIKFQDEIGFINIMLQ